MREPTYFILASLLQGPLHGYAIIKRAEELSGGRVRLATGTLYTALDRLTAEGSLRLVSDEIVNGRVRRSYGLTEPGAAALRAEAIRMAQAAQIVTRDGPPVPARRPARSPRPARAARNARTARAAWNAAAAACCAPTRSPTGPTAARRSSVPCSTPPRPTATGRPRATPGR